MAGSYFFFDGVDWDLGQLASRMLRNIRISNDLSAKSLNGGQFAGHRNRIINGGHYIAQRAVSIPNGTPIYGGADRMLTTVSATTVSAGIATTANVGSPAATGWAHKISGLTTTGTTAISCRNRMPSEIVFDMNSLAVTISGLIWHDFGSAVNWNAELYKANTLDNFGAVTLVANGPTVSVPSSTWTPVSATLTLGASDASNGLMAGFIMPSSAALTSKNVQIANMQFEISPALTIFEKLGAAADLMQCQRYFEKSYDMGSAPGAAVLPGAAQSTAATATILSNGHVRYEVRKRATPTVTIYSPNSGTAGVAAEYNAAGAFVADRACTVVNNGEAGFELQINAVATPGNNVRWHWTASAEL